MKNIIRIYIILFVFIFLSCDKKKDLPLYSFQENGLYGFIDTIGNKVIEPQYLYVSDFHEGLAVAVIDTVYQHINTVLSDSIMLEWGLKKSFQKNIIFRHGILEKSQTIIKYKTTHPNIIQIYITGIISKGVIRRQNKFIMFVNISVF